MNSLIGGYLGLFRRPWARVILLAVFIEAFFFYGAFTFVGADLHQRFDLNYGAVGLMLSFFGLGGLIYTLTVHRLVATLGERGIAVSGGLFIMLGLLSLPFSPLILIPITQALLGLGLYMLHNTLQTNATQMAPDTRGLAVSTFANSLFLGQATGIYAGGILVDNAGFPITYVIAALGLVLLGFFFSRLLQRHTNLA
jgi:predicted MFS family arabinose efflux permease